jgi:hypothetical protein
VFPIFFLRPGSTEKTKQFVLLKITLLLSLIGGGIQTAECAGLDIDLNKKHIDLNDQPISSESGEPKTNADEAQPSTSVQSILAPAADPAANEEIEKIKQECLGQIKRCWDKEKRYDKTRMNPSGLSLDPVIADFIKRHLAGKPLSEMREQKNLLLEEKARSGSTKPLETR